MSHLLGWAWQAWATLAAALWPAAAVLAILTWAALAARAASAKSASTEQRLSWVIEHVLFLDGGTLTGDLHVGGTLWGAGGVLLSGDTVAARQPGSTPPAAEDWHDFPAGINGWGVGAGGWKKYRLTPHGSTEVSICLQYIGTKTDGELIFGAGALPAAYQPGGARKLLPATTNTNALSANWTPCLSFNTDGSVSVYGVNAAGLASVDCHGTIPLI